MFFYSVGGPALPCCYMYLSVQAGKKCSQVVSTHIFYSVGVEGARGRPRWVRECWVFYRQGEGSILRLAR